MRVSKDGRKLSLSNFYCTCCGNKGIPIFRKAGGEREPGHLKKMYCLTCKKETNMAEIRSFGKYNLEDFWTEFSHGNFTKEGKRKEPWNIFVTKVRQRGDDI